MKVLYIAEIVGKGGVYCIKKGLSKAREYYDADAVVANADGVTGGFGIGKSHAVYLRKLGIDAVTTGDQAYFKKDMVEYYDKARHIVRPANHDQNNPGRGWRYFDIGNDTLAVLSLLGQSGYDMLHLSNPFATLPDIVRRIKKVTNYVILDFHANTTAEKQTMFFHADGLVSAVIGSGQRVQTADDTVLPKGTAVICDAGRTGSQGGVWGLDPDIELRKFMRQILERSADCWLDLQLQGVLLDIDTAGRAVAIERVRMPIQAPDRSKETDQ